MNRCFLQRVVLVSALAAVLAGCLDEDPRASAADSVRLAPAGSPAALARHIEAGWEAQGSGALTSQRLLGAPSPAPMPTPERETLWLASADGLLASAAMPVAGAGADSGGSAAVDGSLPVDDGLTNLQVAGVDEADLVKSDGSYLYVAEQPDHWVYPMLAEVAVDDTAGDPVALLLAGDAVVTPVLPSSPRIARYRLPDATAGSGVVELAPLALTGQTDWLSGFRLLLAGGEQPKLVALGHTGHWSWSRWFAPVPFAESQETRLWVFDMADPDVVPAPVSMTLKGELVDSRRIGDILYLVTRYSPSPDHDRLLPLWTVDGTPRPLLAAGECLLPPRAHGHPSLTMIVAVDLNAPQASRASCYAGEVYTFYMSREAIYLAATRANPDFDWNAGIGLLPEPIPRPLAGDVRVALSSLPVSSAPAPVETLVHRFDLNDGAPRYVASGVVPGGFTGWLGTGSQPQWRFHEREGHLFLVTSWWDNTDLRHQLYVLQPDGEGNLAVRATLPNRVQPAPIGKPREDIQAMRYVGDRAYVVTFLRTDPLYVLDLADLLAPRVAGELELPGFSAYLHPVGSDWLLGIGRGATGGVEANLFDVRDPALPRVQQHIPVCTDCDAPLMTDYHALAVQAVAGELRVALPVQRWGTTLDGAWTLPAEQAVLLAIDPLAGLVVEAGRQDVAEGHTALGRVLLSGDRVVQPQVGHVTVGGWPAP